MSVLKDADVEDSEDAAWPSKSLSRSFKEGGAAWLFCDPEAALLLWLGDKDAASFSSCLMMSLIVENPAFLF